MRIRSLQHPPAVWLDYTRYSCDDFSVGELKPQCTDATTPARILFALAGYPAQDSASLAFGRCAICAHDAARTMLFDRWQGANFTDQNKIRTWGATLICEACMWAHSWVPPPGFPAQEEGKKGVNLRLYSHLWDEATGYQYANKATKPLIREWIRERATGRTARCFCAIADTGQKHVIPWTRINLPGARALVVRFEEQDVAIGDWGLITDLTQLLTDGVTKEEIQCGDYRLLSWQQSMAGIERFESHWGVLRGSGWYSVAVWLSQRDEEEYERKQTERRDARAVAKARRGTPDGGKSRVPRSASKKPTDALGPNQRPGFSERPDLGGPGGVGDVAVPPPVSARTRQASLFGDD